MNLSPKHLIKILEAHGFIYKRAKGSHQLYYNSETNKTVTVPSSWWKRYEERSILGILKQVGIDKSE